MLNGSVESLIACVPVTLKFIGLADILIESSAPTDRCGDHQEVSIRIVDSADWRATGIKVRGTSFSSYRESTVTTGSKGHANNAS